MSWEIAAFHPSNLQSRRAVCNYNFFLTLITRVSYFRFFFPLKIVRWHLSPTCPAQVTSALAEPHGARTPRVFAGAAPRLSRGENYTSQRPACPRSWFPAGEARGRARGRCGARSGAHGAGRTREAPRVPDSNPEMARRRDEPRRGAPLMAEGKPDAEVKLILYHWTHSFSSQKVQASASRAERSGFQHPDSSLRGWGHAGLHPAPSLARVRLVGERGQPV